MPYCYQCGKQVKEDAHFCPYCGFRLQEGKPARETHEEEKHKSRRHAAEKKGAKQSEPAEERKKEVLTEEVEETSREEPKTEIKAESDSLGWVWVIVGIILLIVVGIVVWATLQGSLYWPF